MSYGLYAYVVDLEALRAFPGSRDEARVARALEREAAYAERLAEAFADEIRAGAPTVDRALRQIADGATTAGDHAFMYAYAVELLCRAEGQVGSNDMLSAIGGETLDAVNAALAAARAPLSLDDLTEWAPPFPLPRPAGLPGMGTIDHARATAVAAALEAVDIDALMPTDDDETNEVVQESFRELLEWSAGARDGARGGVVVLYY